MSALIRRKGDLITLAEQGEFDVIIHGCNCQNVMGSGIALSIKERYPGAYEADTLATQTWREPVAKLGNFSTYTTAGKSKPFIIVNAYTQVNFAPRGVDHFEYESFALILRKLLTLGPVKVGLPYIGMGLAGGDSARIIPVIEEFAEKMAAQGGSVTLVEFEQVKTNTSKEKLVESLKYQLTKTLERRYGLMVLTREQAEAAVAYLENDLGN